MQPMGIFHPGVSTFETKIIPMDCGLSVRIYILMESDSGKKYLTLRLFKQIHMAPLRFDWDNMAENS